MTNQATESRPALYIPALGQIYESLGGFAYPLLRVTCGGLLIPHGWQKLIEGRVTGTAGFMNALGFPIPTVFAYYIGIVELVGGVLLVLGLFTRAVAALVVGFMFVAVVFVHSQNPYNWSVAGQKFVGGWEMPLMWMLVAIVVLIRGGGDYSVDKSIGKEF